MGDIAGDADMQPPESPTTSLSPAASPPALMPAATYADFAALLGLDLQIEARKVLFARMLDEVDIARWRLSNDPRSLLICLRDDPSIEPPYNVNQITEHAIQQEVTYILEGPGNDVWKENIARECYDKVWVAWILRWLLWRALAEPHLARTRTRTRTGSDAANNVELQGILTLSSLQMKMEMDGPGSVACAEVSCSCCNRGRSLIRAHIM